MPRSTGVRQTTSLLETLNLCPSLAVALCPALMVLLGVTAGIGSAARGAAPLLAFAFSQVVTVAMGPSL